ncbi:MAG: glycosyltransferase [Lachnospiraceae bacterium]|nr:glycosyltransferase [Lachnospiraceae bacterium]
MKILMINKFLHPQGGAETYVFKLGDILSANGHEVQYFGMEHEGRCVGNQVNAYTRKMDFYDGFELSKLTYPVRVIYSSEARKQIRRVLDDFKPDVCHLNNFNYQLTPSIILEIRKWEKQTNHRVRVIFTAHDCQLVCPNHLMRNPNTGENCEKCAQGAFWHCAASGCVHGSYAWSLAGTLEAYFWKSRKVYRQLDTIICPSRFMQSKLAYNQDLKEKLIVLHNFVDAVEPKAVQKKDYVLYFGRYSKEKGIRTLLSVCRDLPDISFVFAGSGPLNREIGGSDNIRNAGFLSGAALEKLIREARFSVCPSEWYENCPFSVIESLMYATPVLGADIGGIPELIENGVTGELFESGSRDDLKRKIRRLWDDREFTDTCSDNCRKIHFNTPSLYYERLMQIYEGRRESVRL